ncbi:Tat pathway signal protein [Streptomyces spiramyceticus]|uniref:Tat pathway signal protein n=1 Tax=Streptomyces spiramyceticus TaxID=299717 RepID=UPI00237BBF45|nr:Tat pathway signal protein [Streptomyces spiramyceticus]
MARTRNEHLAALLAEAGWSRAQAAAAFIRVAQESKLDDFTHIGRGHITMWVGGTMPSGQAPIVLCQALSRRLKRPITPEELGFSDPTPPTQSALDWHIDPLIVLPDLGRSDLNADRRSLLTGAVYSITALALPREDWWVEMASSQPLSPVDSRRVGRGDVAIVQDMTAAFSRVDQQRGGGHGRRALVEYLRTDVTSFLHGHFASEHVRREMYSAAGELSYLSGWMAFDNGDHALAQKYFTLAVKLAAQADDPPLSGHILRAMAHQAIDLGFHQQGLDLASASMEGQRYAAATPRERALLGVVYARSLAAIGKKRAAAKALLNAEDDLSSAGPGIQEPNRTFFFAEASLAHETACTLRECGDREGAVREFNRSVRTRKATTFRRTHLVTLGYLGAVQVAGGRVEEACATWSRALDAMEDGVYSGRARQAVIDIRRLLSPYRNRGVPAAARLSARATGYLSQVD